MPGEGKEIGPEIFTWKNVARQLKMYLPNQEILPNLPTDKSAAAQIVDHWYDTLQEEISDVMQLPESDSNRARLPAMKALREELYALYGKLKDQITKK